MSDYTLKTFIRTPDGQLLPIIDEPTVAELIDLRKEKHKRHYTPPPPPPPSRNAGTDSSKK